MRSTMKLILNLLIINTITVRLCDCGSLISLWETSCKLHADTKHEELKGILKDQHRFNPSNWIHNALAGLTIIISVILTIGCCYMCIKLGPLLSVFNRFRNLNQAQPQSNQQLYSPPFNSTVFTGRTLQFKEILPNQPLNNNQYTQWKYMVHWICSHSRTITLIEIDSYSSFFRCSPSSMFSYLVLYSVRTH